MQRLAAAPLPDQLPSETAIRSCGDNKHGYEPEFWEFQYEVYRYLSRVEEKDLIKRYLGILRNMRALVSPDRHIIPIQTPLSSWYWYRKEHQTRLEFLLRGIPTPADPPTTILDNTPKDAPRRPRHPNCGDVLFRYAKEARLRAMVDAGNIRIGPASQYKDDGLLAAQQDEELEKTSYLPGEYTKLIRADGKSIPIIGDMQRRKAAPNYYALCMACDWDRSLFDDFNADACAIIRDPDAFAGRLEEAGKRHIDGWYFHHNPVSYYDPYEMQKNEFFDAGMCKDFRYAYQREYRFLWMPLKGEVTRGYLQLDLGSLTDVVELQLK